MGDFILIDGFETPQEPADFAAFDRASVTPDDLRYVEGRDGGRALQNDSSSGDWGEIDLPDGSFAFAGHFWALEPSEDGLLVTLRNPDGDTVVTVNLDGDAKLVLDIDGDNKYTGDEVVVEETWQFIELVYRADDDDVDLYRNGSLEATASVSDVSISALRVHWNVGSFPDEVRWDDLAVRTGDDRIGDVSIVPITLVDNGAHTDLDPEPDSDDEWDVVSDLFPKDTRDNESDALNDRYLVADDAGQKRHTFTVDKDSIPEGFTPLAIAAEVSARIGSGGGAGTYEATVRAGGDDYDYAETSLPSSSTRVTHILNANPATDAPWGRDDLDELEVGVRVDINES